MTKYLHITILLAVFTMLPLSAQTLEIDSFEQSATAWTSVSCGSEWTENPDNIGFNRSCGTLMIVRAPGCDNWSGAMTALSTPITGYRYVGGFIGKVDGVSGDHIRLARLGFEGIVTGNNNCGAIIGCIPNNDIVAHFKTCYSIGTINGTAECGALSGWSSRARLTNCYARVRRAGFEVNHDVVRGFTPIFRNCYAYGAKQKSDGLSSFTATELSNGTLLEKLNDPAYSQTIGTDSSPKLRKKESY